MKFNARDFIFDMVRSSLTESMLEAAIERIAEDAVDEIDWDEAISECLDVDRLVNDAIDEVLAEVIG